MPSPTVPAGYDGADDRVVGYRYQEMIAKSLDDPPDVFNVVGYSRPVIGTP
jgi:hypothetical protein